MTDPVGTGSDDPGARIAAAMQSESTPDSTPADTPQGQDSGQATGQKQVADNPAWTPFLADIPEAFHSRLKPHLSKWDENYRGLETKYSELEGKYKQFEPYEKVNPQAITYGLNLVRAINQNPLAVYRMLTDHVTQLGLIQANGQEPDQEPQDERDPWQIQLEERQAELDERQRAQDEWIQKQQYDASVQTYQEQIDSQIQALLAKHGEQAVDIQDVLSRMFNQANTGKDLDAEAAFAESRDAFQRMYSRINQGRQAPNIIPPTGTIAPTETKHVSEMNEEERQAHLVKMLQFVNSQQ